MKKFFAVFAFAACACAFAGGEEFSLEKRLDEEIAKNAGRDFAEKLPDGEKLFYSQSSKSAFIVFSKDLQARNFGFALAGKAELAAEEMFGEVAAFQNPIEIHFLDEGEAKFDGNFLETSRFGSDIVLSVKYSKNLPLDEFFERLARIYLRAYSLKCGGGENPPYWMELALRAMIARQIADFAPMELARVLKKSAPDKVLDVLKYSSESGGNLEKMEASAYFSLLAMRSAFGGSSQAWFETLRQFLVSRDIGDDFMAARFGGDYEDKLWVGVYGEFYARLSGVKDCKASDADAAYLFTIQKMRKSAPAEIIAGGEIFARRGDLKNEITTRIAEIKVELPWSNPVYYNLFVSIGKMYDAALRGDDEDFEKFLAESLYEFKKAREIASQIEKLMGEKNKPVALPKTASARSK